MAEEREKLRTLVVPFASVDEILDALRTPADSFVSDEEVARGWGRPLFAHRARRRRRRRRQRQRHGNGQDVAPGDPPSAPAQLGAPSSYLEGGKLLGALAVTFFAGALSGAAVLYAILSHHRAREASFITTETPAPVPAPQPTPEPAPSASAAPSVRRSRNRHRRPMGSGSVAEPGARGAGGRHPCTGARAHERPREPVPEEHTGKARRGRHPCAPRSPPARRGGSTRREARALGTVVRSGDGVAVRPSAFVT